MPSSTKKYVPPSSRTIKLNEYPELIKKTNKPTPKNDKVPLNYKNIDDTCFQPEIPSKLVQLTTWGSPRTTSIDEYEYEDEDPEEFNRRAHIAFNHIIDIRYQHSKDFIEMYGLHTFYKEYDPHTYVEMLNLAEEEEYTLEID